MAWGVIGEHVGDFMQLRKKLLGLKIDLVLDLQYNCQFLCQSTQKIGNVRRLQDSEEIRYTLQSLAGMNLWVLMLSCMDEKFPSSDKSLPSGTKPSTMSSWSSSVVWSSPRV